MTVRRLLVILLISAIALLAFGWVGTHLFHHCTGVDCALCKQIVLMQNGFDGTDAVVIALSGCVILWVRRVRRRTHPPSHLVHPSLVALRTKLSC